MPRPRARAEERAGGAADEEARFGIVAWLENAASSFGALRN